MVQVEVREDEQVDPLDPQLPQTVRERLGVGTGVDQQHRIARAHENGVALAHVARGDGPLRRDGGAGDGVGDRTRGECGRHGCCEHQDRGHPCPPAGTDDEHRDGGADDAEGDEPHPTLRPGEGGAGQPGDLARGGGDPRGRQPREGRQPRSQVRDAGAQAGRESDHRPEWRGGRREDVREHAQHRHGRSDQHDQRSARELCRQRHRDEQGERCRHPSAESFGERAGEHEQRPGGRDREGEPERAGQPRVGDQQDRDRRGQQRETGAGAAEQQPEHRDRRHRRGAHDARLRRDQHDERDQCAEARRHADAATQTAQGGEGVGDSDDERAVRPADGGEVGQRRCLHLGIQFRSDGAGVAHGQSRDEPAAGRRQLGRQRDETATQRRRGAQDARG